MICLLDVALEFIRFITSSRAVLFLLIWAKALAYHSCRKKKKTTFIVFVFQVGEHLAIQLLWFTITSLCDSFSDLIRIQIPMKEIS